MVDRTLPVSHDVYGSVEILNHCIRLEDQAVVESRVEELNSRVATNIFQSLNEQVKYWCFCSIHIDSQHHLCTLSLSQESKSVVKELYLRTKAH